MKIEIIIDDGSKVFNDILNLLKNKENYAASLLDEEHAPTVRSVYVKDGKVETDYTRDDSMYNINKVK
jgi:hypothetical protein